MWVKWYKRAHDCSLIEARNVLFQRHGPPEPNKYGRDPETDIVGAIMDISAQEEK